MATYNIHQARSQLSKLIDAMQRGERVIIANSGKPVAVLAPVHEAKQPRTRGALKGQIQLGPEFDEALPEEIIESFERPG